MFSSFVFWSVVLYQVYYIETVQLFWILLLPPQPPRNTGYTLRITGVINAASSTYISSQFSPNESFRKCETEDCQRLSPLHLPGMLSLLPSDWWVIQFQNPNLKGYFVGYEEPAVLVWVPSESQTWDKEVEVYSLLERQSQKMGGHGKSKMRKS